MNTNDFNRIFSKVSFKGVWGGAVPANFIAQLTFHGPKLIVLNTDESGGKGKHWVSMYVPSRGPLEFFDPLGRSPQEYHRYFRTWLISVGRGYMYNSRRYQDYDSSSCGEFCGYIGVRRLEGRSMRETLNSLDA